MAYQPLRSFPGWALPLMTVMRLAEGHAVGGGGVSPLGPAAPLAVLFPARELFLGRFRLARPPPFCKIPSQFPARMIKAGRPLVLFLFVDITPFF